MPKAAALRKVTAIRGAPVDGAVKFRSINRGRNKTGRATANNVKTTLEFLPSEPEPTPPPLPTLLDTYPESPQSGDEEGIQLKTPKGPSKAVSVSLCASRGINSS